MPQSVARYPLPPAASLTESCEAAATGLARRIIGIHFTFTFGPRTSQTIPRLLSPALLDSAVHRPFFLFGDEFQYATGLEQAAALFQSLVLNHVFEDGNKRTALTSCLYFLERCGYWRHVALLTDLEGRLLETLTLLVARERAMLQSGELNAPYEIAQIAEALDNILSPSHGRRLRSGAFHSLADLLAGANSEAN